MRQTGLQRPGTDKLTLPLPESQHETIKTLQTTTIPPEIIQYAVWLYHRFKLSYRDLEGLLVERGITVS